MNSTSYFADAPLEDLRGRIGNDIFIQSWLASTSCVPPRQFPLSGA